MNQIQLSEALIKEGEELFYDNLLEDEEKQSIDMRVVKRLLLDGFSEKYVRSVLDISDTLWSELKKGNARFKRLIDNWVMADREGVAVAMKARAKGIRYTEVKRVRREVFDQATNQMKVEMVPVEENEKFTAPDVGAGKFLLTNLDADTYKDKRVHEVTTTNSYEQQLLEARKRKKAAAIEVSAVEKLPEPVKEEAPPKPRKKSVRKPVELKGKKGLETGYKIDAIGLEGLL